MLLGRLGRAVSRSPVTELAVLASVLCCAGCFLGGDRVWIERSSAASGAESVEEVPIGQAPAGYRTLVPLSSPLPPTSLDAAVTRTRSDGVVTFKLADLKEGSLRVDAALFSQHHSGDRDRFLSVNRKDC